MSQKDLQQSPAYKRWQGRHQAAKNTQANPSDPEEIGYKCLCCKDTSLIPGESIRVYLDEYYGLLHPDTGELVEFEGAFVASVSETPFQCNRCQAYMMEVMTDTGRRSVDRWAEGAVDLSISKEICQWIHEEELKKLRQAAKAAEVNEAAKAMMEEIHQETAIRLAQLETPDQAKGKTANFSRLADALGVPLPPLPETTAPKPIPPTPVVEAELVPEFFSELPEPKPMTATPDAAIDPLDDPLADPPQRVIRIVEEAEF